MSYKTKNTYTVHFHDGTSFSSQGSSDGIKKSSVSEEFKWVAFHIEKEVSQKGKTLNDVKSIEYNLNYNL